jgi:hypothetical protein
MPISTGAQKNPVAYLFDYVAFGRGDTAPVTREVLRQAEPNAEKRPSIHVGGTSNGGCGL